MNRQQQMDHESTSVVAAEHKGLPVPVAVEMFHHQLDARMDMDWILACMGSFVKNQVVAIGKQPPQHRRPLVW